ncbi:hypothetical protein HHI36_022438 [Cryptolaemus montrouzieri]|uniref:Scavenger receptor class B member 1 n=1 Tax=Cryptolaemus montrouzieri TaxID=559131 RepID=A0ABD2N122_9CUCU
MRDLIRLWNRLVGGTYDVVNTNARFKQDHVDIKTETRASKRAACRRRAITFVVLGIASILSGVLMYVINPYDLIYKYKVKFSEGSEIFELWRTPPVELYLRVFLWNITNSEEFMSGTDQKLKVQEVGPYVYRELLSHDNITFNDNGTLTAIPSHPLVFVPELSEGRLENDSLILPNIALLSIAHVVSDESYFTRLGLNMLIRQTNQQPLVQMTAREFMFNYTNALMNLGNKFLPNWITFENLGLIDRMYDFDGDFETVYTGEDDIRKAGLIDMWRGSTKIPQWENPCGNVRGSSDGTRFPSYIQPDEKLFFYRKSMCRARHLVKVNDTVAAGFKSFVYNFENSNDWNEKDCFCYDKNNCFPRGLLDVHECYYGFPIALSSPHFHGNDPILKAHVEGVNPDPEKHSSYFVIEPHSGTPIELRASFQINMALKNIKTIAHVERFSDIVLPLLWAEFRMYGLPDYIQFKLFIYIQFLPVLTDVLMYSSVIGGILILACSIYRLTRVKKSENKRQSPWIHDAPHYIKNKLSNYRADKASANMMDARELETYYHSVIVPLTQEIGAMEESSNNRRASATA